MACNGEGGEIGVLGQMQGSRVVALKLVGWAALGELSSDIRAWRCVGMAVALPPASGGSGPCIGQQWPCPPVSSCSASAVSCGSSRRTP